MGKKEPYFVLWRETLMGFFCRPGFGKALMVIGLIVLFAWMLRLIGLGSFMTVDEEKWMLRSGEFYHKLFDWKDPGGTFTTTHPGATVQWLAGAGIYLQEKNLGLGIDTSNLRLFRLASTLPVAAAIAILIGVTVCLLIVLLGRPIAYWSGFLLAVEPYLVGSSQIAHVDMLLALFMLDSVLSSLLWLKHKAWSWLALAGLFAGLSLATKTLPAIWLLIFFAGMMKISALTDDSLAGERLYRRYFYKIGWVARQWFFVLGVAVLTFWLVWPALWIKSGLGAYYQRDIASAVQQEHVALEELAKPIQPAGFYGRTVLGRTSPFVLFISLGLVVLVARMHLSPLVARHLLGRLPRHDGRAMADGSVSVRYPTWLLLYAFGYLIMITWAAKKADRYAMPALAVLPVMAGGGLTVAWLVVKNKISCLACRPVKISLLFLLLAALMVQTLLWSPHTIAYNNPLFAQIRPLSQQGWGEGLEAAAVWLNEHPLADRLVIASWYPGVMRTFFNGETMSLSSRTDDRVGLVALYRNMLGRPSDDAASQIWQEYQNKQPVHIVAIGGLPYVWIYEQLGLYYFPQHIGELTGGIEVGQTVVAPPNWQSVEVGFNTFSSRHNTKDVIMQIRTTPDEVDAIRTVTVQGDKIQDGAWHRFDFPTIANAGGKEYYVGLLSPESRPGDAVTVRYVGRDVVPGKMLWRRQPLAPPENNGDFFRPDWDLAVQVVSNQ